MREAIKSTSRVVAFLLILPALFSYTVRAWIVGRHRALEGSTQMLSLIPGIAGQYLRGAFLRSVLAHCAPTATISFGTVFSRADAKIGAGVYIGPGCFLGRVQIDDDVLIGSGVHVTSGARTHGIGDPNRPIREQEGNRTLVTIGAGSWIGSGAIIMADVGARAVVGAGAVVTSAIPEATVAAGVPARVLRERS